MVHGLRVADRYVSHPVMTPDGVSPGDGLGYLFAGMFFALATPVCLVPSVLWLVARHRAGRGGAFLRTARVAATLVVILAVLSLWVAAHLPHAWADVTVLAVACVVGLGAMAVPPRRVAAWAAAAADQNQA